MKIKWWHWVLLGLGCSIIIGGSIALILRIDNPQYTVDEVCALVWTRLPAELQGGYSKVQFSSVTRKATYQGDGKWLFEVSGSDMRSFIEHGEESRVSASFHTEYQSRWVNKIYELKLKAYFYKRTGIVEVIGINSSLVEKTTGEWTFDN